MYPDGLQLTRRNALAAGVLTTAGAIGLPRQWFSSEFTAASATDDGGWPTGQHDPAGTGATADSVTVQTHNQPAWVAKVDERVLGIVAGGSRLFYTTAHTVGAIDRSDGSIDWEVSQFDPIPWHNGELSFDSPPTVRGNQLLVNASGSVVALDPDDGTTRWEFETDGTITSVLALGNTVYCDGTLGDEQVTIALDTTTGFERFRIESERAIYPQVASDGLLIGTSIHDPQVARAVSTKTGTERWHAELAVAHESAALPGTGGPCIVDDTVLFGGGTVTALALDDGTPRWRTALDIPNTGRFAVVSEGEMAIVISMDADQVTAIPLDTGDVQWSMSEIGLADWKPALTPDILYVCVEDGMYTAVPTTGLAPLPKFSAFSAMWSPIVVEGVLYAVRSDGVVRLKGQ